MEIRRGIYECVLAAAMFALAGCRTAPASMSAAVDPSGWQSGSMRVVRYHNTDTTTLRDLTLFVVHDSRVADEALEVGVEMFAPGGTRFSETVLLPVEAPDEKNIIRQSSRTYRRQVTLKEAGDYRIILKNNSSKPLRGVRAVGIEITES